MTIWPTADNIAMLLLYLAGTLYVLAVSILILALKKK